MRCYRHLGCCWSDGEDKTRRRRLQRLPQPLRNGKEKDRPRLPLPSLQPWMVEEEVVAGVAYLLSMMERSIDWSVWRTLLACRYGPLRWGIPNRNWKRPIWVDCCCYWTLAIPCRLALEISWMKRIREWSASFCGGRPTANRNWPDIVVAGDGWLNGVEGRPKLDGSAG